jgi:hypothetical protein
MGDQQRSGEIARSVARRTATLAALLLTLRPATIDALAIDDESPANAVPITGLDQAGFANPAATALQSVRLRRSRPHRQVVAAFQATRQPG